MKKNTQQYDLIVIGGGAAGMMMAGRAAECGAHVLLLEKNPELGKKLSITGGGRCNITNAEFNVRTFLDNFPESKEFLFSPFSQFSAKDTLSFFEQKGLELVVEARKRAFPKTQRAEDVTKTMVAYIKKHHVRVVTNACVTSIKQRAGDSYGVKTESGEEYVAPKIAIATGGRAAPETGSTGDGFRFLKKLGHTIALPNPNIVPLKTDATWLHALSGLSLSFMRIRFMQDGKTKIKKLGKILFTHFGISGPLVLNSSFEVGKLLTHGPVTAEIDLFPDSEEPDLDRKVLRLFEKNKNKMAKHVFPEFVPKGLGLAILELPDVALADKKVHSVTKEERQMLVKKMKRLTFGVTGTLGFDKAVIADGGVAPEEVDFKTMTSKLHLNIYLLGDVLNINRPSGGYSLQLAWTTGWVAGTHAAGAGVKSAKSA